MYGHLRPPPAAVAAVCEAAASGECNRQGEEGGALLRANPFLSVFAS